MIFSRLKTPETLPEHVFEIDAEVEEKEKDEVYKLTVFVSHLLFIIYNFRLLLFETSISI